MKSKAETSVLFRRLRLRAQKNGYVLYNVLVRKAGIGFSYVEDGSCVDAEHIRPTVFCYHDGSLRSAVIGELERWSGRS